MTDTPTNNPWIRRILAILAKAESTDSYEEAESFFARAQELIARHGIEETELARLGRHADGTAMGTERIEITNPYLVAKSGILAAIGNANGVLVHRTTGPNATVSITGREADRALVRAMFGTVITTAERHLAAADIPPFESTRAFRNSFYLGYGDRLYDRLAETNRETTGAGTSAEIVAVDRIDAARAHLKADGMRLRTLRSSSSSEAGHHAGQTAADRTNLNDSIAGGRRALGA